MKKILFTAFILFLSIISFGQKGIIKGFVVDDVTGEPMIGATVMIIGTTSGSLTDFDGSYIIEVDSGTYNLQYTYISYKKYIRNNVVVKYDEETVIENIVLKEDLLEMAEVLVIGEAIKTSESSIINMKMKSSNMIDGISSEKISKTGDGNVAEASKRVSGVNIENGKYVFVRGLGDRYVKTTLNGVDIPGLDPDKNTIQLDIFPTNLINNVIVSKTFMPDLPGDFTGGLINIETKFAPEKLFRSISFGTSYNPQYHFNKNFLTYKGSKTDFLGFDGGVRSLPRMAYGQILPTPYNNIPTEHVIKFINSFSKTMGVDRKMSLIDFNASFSIGNQIKLKKGNLGYIFSTSYKSDYVYYGDVIYGEYQRNANNSINELTYATKTIGELSERNFLLSGLGSINYSTVNSKYKLSLIHLQNGESRTGKFNIINNSSAVGQSGYEAISDNLEYNQRSLTNIMISGNNRLKNKWEIDYLTSTTYSSSIDPDIRKTAFSYDGSYSFASGEAGNPNRIWRSLNELNIVSKIDFTKRYKAFNKDAKIKFGISNVYKNRNYNIKLYEILFSRQQYWESPDASQVLSSNNIYGNSLNGSYIQSGNANPNPNQYSSDVNNNSFYVLNELSYKKIKTIIGVRGEYFLQRHTGRDIAFSGGDSINGKNLVNTKVLESFNFFPSVNMVYSITSKINLRTSYTRTIARPSFKELSFAQILDPITNRIFNGSLFSYYKIVEGKMVYSWDGNLKETNIDNVDIRYEMSFKNEQNLSISGFYKHFKNPIELVRIPEQQTSTEYQTRNMDNGYLLGLEFDIKKNIFKNLYVSSNITIVKSQISMTDLEYNSRKSYERIGEIIDNKRTMVDQSPYVLNCGVNYNNDKIGIDVGVYYNVKGRTLNIVGTGLVPDIYTEPFNSLNFSIIKKFKKTSIDFKVVNILNEKVEVYYHSYNADKQIFSSRNPGINFSFSIKHNF